MLVNSKNQLVNIPDRFSSVTHPKLFAPLHEKHEPKDIKGGMFRMEARARIIEGKK